MLLIVLLVNLITFKKAGSFAVNLKECCDFGYDIAKMTNNCSITPDPNIFIDSFCLVTKRSCCEKKLKENHCVIGQKKALLNENCLNLTYIDEKNCCESCKHVLNAVSKLKISCNEALVILPEQYIINSFQNCCTTHIPLNNTTSKTLTNNGKKSNKVLSSNVNDLLYDFSNECDEFTRKLCGHICKRTMGSFVCECRSGFVLMSDKKSCRKIVTSVQKCSLGYTITKNGCIDNNECLNENICDSNQDCVNTIGSYRCNCKKGFMLDSITAACVDVNECLMENACTSSQRCDNLIGSYRCIRVTNCGTGYTLNAYNGKCEDDDECSLAIHNCHSLGPNYFCKNTLGSFRCMKKSLSNNVINITQEISSSTTTFKNMSSYLITPNEHTTALTITTVHSSSTPLTVEIPLIKIKCYSGFYLDKGQCKDINECVSNPCSSLETCVNSEGSFSCVKRILYCNSGFVPNSNNTECIDLDECTLGIHKCNALQTCINRRGYYSCKCPMGFKINSLNECEDINECQLYKHRICSTNSVCENSPGSYNCICNKGFKKAHVDVCMDIDECTENIDLCDHLCFNSWGSYSCGCKRGYILNFDNKSCSDINECEFEKNNRKLCVHKCVNTMGSYKCKCPSGYQLSTDGISCIDINECDQKSPCQSEEICTNLRGGFKCYQINCPVNYVRDSYEKNRCLLQTNYCHIHDKKCQILPSTYSYHFFTMVSKFPVDNNGIQIFAMKGPQNKLVSCSFKISLVTIKTYKNITAANENFFKISNYDFNQIVLIIMKSLEGPQDIELQITMDVFKNGFYSNSAIAKLLIYVSEYEF